MSFGLVNAPATFQGMINQVLQQFLDQVVVGYLDEHEAMVTKVFQRLEDKRLVVSPT